MNEIQQTRDRRKGIRRADTRRLSWMAVAAMIIVALSACRSPYMPQPLLIVANNTAKLGDASLAMGTGDQASSVTQSFKLPVSGTGNTAISWVSDAPGLVTIGSDGTVTLARPEVDTPVTLTATVKNGSVTSTKTMTIMVKGKNSGTATQNAAADKANLSLESLRFRTGDTPLSITAPFTLPTAGLYGSLISWTSSDPSIAVTAAGGLVTVSRPSVDTEVVLTAAISTGNVIEYKTFTVVVKKKTVEAGAATVAEDKAALAEAPMAFGGTDDATSITQEFTLPAYGPNGSALTWTSSDPSVAAIKTGDVIKVQVKRKASSGTGDFPVTLTASIANGGIVESSTFNITVKQKTAAPGAETVAADQATLGVPAFDFGPNDIASAVTQNFNVPMMGPNGSSYTWTSSDPLIASPSGDGTVVIARPAVDTPVTLKVTITENGVTETREIQIIVLHVTASPGKETVAADKAALDASSLIFAGNDTSSSITQHFEVPLSGPNGSTITWASSDPGTAAPSADGRVTISRGDSDRQVTLTATIKNGDAIETKTITVTVCGKTAKPGAESLAADKATLDEPNLVFSGHDQADTITEDFWLPPRGPNGSTYTWTSSNPDVAQPDAEGHVVVTRKLTDTPFTLTAKIENGNDSSTLSLDCRVKAKTAADGKETVAADSETLRNSSPLFGPDDNTDSVTEDFGLPTTGPNGSTITWTSDNPQVASPDSRGAVDVTPPDKDTEVTLRATIQHGAVSETKEIVIIVKKKSLTPSDAESVIADKAALAISFAKGDTASAITKDITLPTSGPNGSTISWNSDAPTVIGPTGVVNRDPADDKDVTLTATIKKGSHIEVVSIKVTLKRLTGGKTGPVVNAVTVTLTRSGTGTTLSLGTTMTVTATTSSPVDSYAWYLDGTVVTGQTSSSFSGGSSLVRGVHTLTAVVNLGGNLFSAIYYFTVQSGVAR